jgi:putative nucleotidyltransferase with HDIG domain
MAVSSDGNLESRSQRRDKSEFSGSTWARVLLFGLALALVTSAVLTIRFLPTNQITLDEGQISPKEIVAPYQKTFVSEILTERARLAAEQNVPRVYDGPDPQVAYQQVTRARNVLEFINTVRHDIYATAQEQQAYLSAIEGVPLSTDIISQTLVLSDEHWKEVIEQTVRAVEDVMRREIREGEVNQMRRLVASRVSFDLTDEQRQVVANVAKPLIQANTFYNAENTATEREAARATVPPIERTVMEGQAIVRRGIQVDAEAIEILKEYGLLQPRLDWLKVASTVTFALFLVLLFLGYLLRFQSFILNKGRLLLLLFLLLSLFLAAARFMVPGHTILPYAFPLAAMGMLICTLIDGQLAMASLMFIGAVIAFMTDGSLELAVYALGGSLLATLAVGRVQRLSTFAWGGVYVVMANLAVLALFRLPPQETDPEGWLTLGAATVVNGGLSVSLTLAGFYLLGQLFDLTTTLRLMELARPTHPLLRQLLLKAPGTYHHSILVSNMAEQAAEQIGADALLTRVGTFYHDIGKTTRPYFFTENQADGTNAHERLDPQTSAEIIISHVKDGLDMAKKYRLPSAIRDFIPQHQGTGLVTFFYHKACQEAGGPENVDQAKFRYPGPKPQTKEIAIVMLADSCEAAVRANRPSSKEGIEEIIRRVTDEKLLAGELDECDLTLRDLEQIRQAFASTLSGVFHPRVKYPETHTTRASEPDRTRPDTESDSDSENVIGESTQPA